MLVKELLGSKNNPIQGESISFFVNNEKIMTIENYKMVAPLFDNLIIKQWGFNWGSRSIDIEVTHWNAKEFVNTYTPYLDDYVDNDAMVVDAVWKDENKDINSVAHPYEPEPYIHGYFDGKVHDISLESLPTQLPSKYDNLDIRNLSLCKGCINRLNSVGISSIGELREFTAEDLLSIKRFGKRYLQDVKDALKGYGLKLKEN